MFPAFGDERWDAPRCGHPDAYVVLGRWDKSILTYWLGDPAPFRLIPRRRQWRALQWAMSKWSEATLGRLRFKGKLAREREVDLYIKFVRGDHGDGASFDGPGGILAHAFIPTDQQEYFLEGDIHFDEDEAWDKWLDLETVALHEVGHALGLGHSAERDAVMYPYYTGIKRALHDDDIRAIRAIYGGE